MLLIYNMLLVVVLLLFVSGSYGVAPIWEKEPVYVDIIKLGFKLTLSQHSVHFAEKGK